MIHELKATDFKSVKDGTKPFEIRYDHCNNYQVGDILILKEFDDGNTAVDKVTREITYIHHSEQLDNYIVLGIKKVMVDNDKLPFEVDPHESND